jgi:DNA invertase Pin-like site-specific DNA recombinase
MAEELQANGNQKTEIDKIYASITTGNSASFAAKATGIGLSTIYREINKGNIPVIKIGERKTIPGWWIMEKITRPDSDAAA